MVDWLCTNLCTTRGVGPTQDDFVRVGDKLISRRKISETISRVLDLRYHGLSQQEVADRLHLDRTFISRLETIGEIRKGVRIALIGFPLQNVEELRAVASEEGVEFALLLTERERNEFVRLRSGLELFNDLMDLVATVRQHDVVILLGSDKRIRVIQALLDREVIGLEIGKSPINEDKYVDPEELRRLIRQLRRD